MKKLNVIGLGYIGLPTALMLAANGVKVVGTDINHQIVDSLNQGIVSFEEKGLVELFEEARKKGVEFSTSYIQTDCYLITVPTPYIASSKQIDIKYVEQAVQTVLEICEDNTIIIIESTISPGTIDRYIRPIVKKSDKTIHLVHAPERIIPGNMIYELKYNSRTIGADDQSVAERIKQLYASFCEGEIVTTDIKTAEMSKVVENTFRDINIAFANELAMICYEAGMDVYEVIKIANKHPRVNILQPGPGVGGHCISVDPWFLVGDFPEQSKLIKQARYINDAMPSFVLSRVSEIAKKNHISFDKIGFYGLTYKENVDDTRESPTLQLLEKMEHALASAPKVYDPFVQSKVVENQYFDLDTFLNDVELVVIMVAHDELLQQQTKFDNKVVFDTRNKLSGKNIIKL